MEWREYQDSFYPHLPPNKKKYTKTQKIIPYLNEQSLLNKTIDVPLLPNSPPQALWIPIPPPSRLLYCLPTRVLPNPAIPNKFSHQFQHHPRYFRQLDIKCQRLHVSEQRNSKQMHHLLLPTTHATQLHNGCPPSQSFLC